MKTIGFNMHIPEWFRKSQTKNEQSKSSSVKIIEDEATDDEIDEIQFQVIFLLVHGILRNGF